MLSVDRGRLQTSWKASEECRTTVKRLTTKVAQLRSGSGSKGKKESTAGKRKPVSFEGEGNWTREKAESLMPAGYFMYRDDFSKRWRGYHPRLKYTCSKSWGVSGNESIAVHSIAKTCWDHYIGLNPTKTCPWHFTGEH